MIIPIRVEGTKPPLIMVHGLFGVMPLGQRLARALGPGHPVQAIHARGLDGSPHESVEEMARDHLSDVRRFHPRGPYILGGMCAGCLVALEMARQLRAAGETAESVLMLEPNPVLNLHPPQKKLDAELESAVTAQIRAVARGWYKLYLPTFDSVPFDFADPRLLDRAADVGASLVLAYERYRPQPYSGRVDIIASDPFAKLITNENLPWRREILVGPWAIQAITGSHEEFFLRGAPAMLGTVQKVVQALDTPSELVRV